MLIPCYNRGYDKQILTVSQRQAVITLLDKDKDRLLLKNWRPISLLNTDYKIMTKAIANRIKKVLPEIIHHNQTGYVEGRYIGDSVRQVLDLFEYMDNENISGLLVCTDFEKAFDYLNWKFMLKTLENFNFGPSVNQWVNTFYSDISACTINNGYTSGYFKLERGVRQGDPLSPYLFILAMEVLAHVVREEKSIRGIKLGETELKIVLFADDNSGLFADKISAKTFLNLVNEFGKYSGLKLNIEKTEAMWLGSAKHNLDKPLDLKWSDKVIKILGIHFGHNKQEMVRANYESKVQSLKTTLAIWKMRDLTLNGRILISKVLGLSKFDYTLSVLTMPKGIIRRVNDIIWSFIWKGKKKGKIRREVLFCEYEDGGQQMLDLETRIETARIKCLKRYFYGVQHHWKVLFNQFFSVYGGIQNLLCGNLDSKTLSEFPQFQQEVIRTWSKLSYNNKKFIWNNKAITVNKLLGCEIYNHLMEDILTP